MAKANLRVGYLPIVDHLILGMAKEKQLEKTDLQLEKKFGWNEIGDSLKAGEIDVAFMLAPYAMDLFYSEKNVKLLLLSHRDGSVIVANKAANINSIADFKGKTILIPYQASMHNILLHKKLKEEGLSLGIGKDVTTEVTAPGQIPMMIEYDPDGFIAGYIVAEPFGTQVVNNGLGTVMNLSKEIMPNHPCCAVVVRDDVIKNNPESVQELISALVEAGKAVYTNIESTVKTAMDFLGQTEPVVRAILEDPNRRVSMDKLMPKADEFTFIQDYLLDTVTTPALSGKINVNDFLDLSFAKNAGAE
ncbi:MAG: ABC transporter substrate-binding protein [Defluviitaleaceae bacterium]|nr:ABC transporter substrate-binding protein [Defluviitaleaceae bacterium]